MAKLVQKIITPATAMDEELWVLADPEDGALIGVDSASGGYPWKPGYWSGVRVWHSRADAERYSGGQYAVLKATVIITEPNGD